MHAWCLPSVFVECRVPTVVLLSAVPGQSVVQTLYFLQTITATVGQNYAHSLQFTKVIISISFQFVLWYNVCLFHPSKEDPLQLSTAQPHLDKIPSQGQGLSPNLKLFCLNFNKHTKCTLCTDAIWFRDIYQ